MMNFENITIYQWGLLLVSSLLLIWLSPMSKTATRFFQAAKDNKAVSLWLLTSSLVISWIFAKSITNAANLGLKYGLLGGLAYATYYLSFLVAGFFIYNIRVKGGFKSIHEFLATKFGKGAVVLFSLLIGFRLFNEVWSNTMVIGSYFGANGSNGYYAAIVVFTVLTLVYSLKGGLSSSMFTDAIQMVFFGGLLLIILTMILPRFESSAFASTWSLSGGLDLMLVALIQCFSYPFHDPVMTDRGFITDPKTMKKAFILAAPIGFVSILLFSLVGVYARQLGLAGDATVQVAHSLGVVLTILVNFIMITSASSTLDSAFASFSKLSIVDLSLFKVTVSNGRWVMVFMTVLGTIPIFFNPEVLSATTVSGTMVIGLAPMFLLWRLNVPKSTFLIVVLIGCVFGIVLTVGVFPARWVMSESYYGTLLSVNVVGTLVCFVVYSMMWLLKKQLTK